MKLFVQRCKQPTRYNIFHLLIFLLIYLNLLCMFPATNSPIIRSTLDCIYTFGTIHRYCCNISALYQTCIYSLKCSWWWAILSPETCRADSNRSIKRSINEKCCILLVAYIIVLIMHILTNFKFRNYLYLFLWGLSHLEKHIAWEAL
jgi:hypothetical protein